MTATTEAPAASSGGPPAPVTAETEATLADGIDAIPSMNEEPKPKAAKAPAATKPEAKEEPAKPEVKAPEKPEPKAKAPREGLDDIPEEPEAPAAKETKAEPEPVEPKTNKELREDRAKHMAEAATLKKEKAEWAKQVETAKREGGETATKTLKTELEKITKERDELSEKIRFVDYKSSGEFKEKYEKPLREAWQSALEEIEGFQIENEDGTTTKVDARHLHQLLQLSAGEANRLATKVFGPDAAAMLSHRRTILGLQRASDTATEEWKTKGSEMSAAQEKAREEHHVALRTAFDGTIRELETNLPEVFSRPSDDETAAFWDKGSELVDLAFRGKGLPEGLTPQQRGARVAKAQASLAARARSFGAQRHQLMKALSDVKELREEIAGYKASGPKPTQSTSEAAASDSESIEAGIDRIKSY